MGKIQPTGFKGLNMKTKDYSAKAADRSLLGGEASWVLRQLATQIPANVEGHIAEVGVYQGGSAKVIAECAPGNRDIFLYDTFQGMPQEGPEDNHHKKGDFNNTSLGEVRRFLADHKNVWFKPGLFPKSVGSEWRRLYCFVHLDCDLYSSTREALDFYWPRLNPGGAVLIDDYGHLTTLGAKKAVDEFAGQRGLTVLQLPRTGQALIWKSMILTAVEGG